METCHDAFDFISNHCASTRYFVSMVRSLLDSIGLKSEGRNMTNDIAVDA